MGGRKAGACLCFCCLGGGVFHFLLFGRGGVLFFDVWAWALFLWLFGRGLFWMLLFG